MGEGLDTFERRDELAAMVGRELSAVTVMFHTAVAERLGLSVTEHKALDIIIRSNGITAGQLAGFTGLTTGAVTGLVDRLEGAGYIRRRRDPNDRRRVIVEAVLAPEHEREFNDIFEPLTQDITQLTSRYRPEELAVILDFTTRAIDILEKATLRLRSKPADKAGPVHDASA